MIEIPWKDLPTFDWRSVVSAALGAVTVWLSSLLSKKKR